MKNLLIMGINTRPLVKSAQDLDYNIFTSTYYFTEDFEKLDKRVHLLKQKENKTCGYLFNKYSPKALIENSKDLLEEADSIILYTGISPDDFTSKYKKKIIGNKSTKNINDKFYFYKKIKNKFLVPLTFKISDIDECKEILKQYDDKSFIIKPLVGAGGYGVKLANKESLNQLNDMEFILQEFVNGINLSSSVLSSSKEAKTIINSRLLSENEILHNNDFRYCGNILPLDIHSINTYNNFNISKDESGMKKLNEDLNTSSEKLIKQFKLIGSNGVDIILLNDDFYIIELNPRLQGSYESIENVLNINLLDAHIKACHGEIINTGKAKGYSFKRIIYSPQKVKVDDLDFNNVYDIPKENTIIEKDEPLVTIITKENNLKNNIKTAENSLDKVKNNIKNCRKQFR